MIAPPESMMNNNNHTPEILERLKANSEAAMKRLAQLNHEYRVREQARRLSQIKVDAAAKTCGQL